MQNNPTLHRCDANENPDDEKKKNGGEKNPSVTKKQPLRFGLSAGKCVYLTRDFGFCESDCEQMQKDVTRRLNQSGVGWNLIHLSHP